MWRRRHLFVHDLLSAPRKSDNIFTKLSVAVSYQRQSHCTQETLAQAISVSRLLTQTTVDNPGVLPDPVPHLPQGLVPGVFRLSQFLQGHQLCLPRQAALVLVRTTNPLRHLCNSCNMSGQTFAEDLQAVGPKHRSVSKFVNSDVRDLNLCGDTF